MRRRRAQRPEDAEDVHLVSAAELLGGQLGEVVHRRLRGGVGHQDVDRPEFAHGALDHRGAVRLVGHVAADELAAAALAPHQVGGVLGVGVLAEIADGDVGALLGEGHRHRAPDTGVAAGDERGLALQQAAADVAGHLVAGLGVHGPGLTGVGLLLGGRVGHGRLPPSSSGFTLSTAAGRTRAPRGFVRRSARGVRHRRAGGGARTGRRAGQPVDSPLTSAMSRLTSSGPP